MAKKMQKERIPPHSNEAEQAVIGAMMTNPEAIATVCDVLNICAPFYSLAHRNVYSAIMSLFEKSHPVDITTVAEELEKGDKLVSCDGRTYLADLASCVATASNVEYHAKIVLDDYQLRQLIYASGQNIAEGYAKAEDTQLIIDKAAKRVFDIQTQNGGPVEFRRIGDMGAEIVKEYDEKRARGDGLTGLSTGYTDLDDKLGGLKPGHLYIIGGRPSMGKSALAQNILDNICDQDPEACALFFSLEMPVIDLAKRSIFGKAGVSYADADRAKLSDKDVDKVTQEMGRFSKNNVWVVNTSSLTPTQLWAKTRRFTSQHPLSIICLDYIQLMTANVAKGDNRNLQISEITRQLKAVALEFNVPVIALSQLSRNVENRDDKRPRLSDLRDSGSIEQDADVVAFVYRDEYYKQHLRDDDTDLEKALKKKHLAEIIIEKNRNGPKGVVEMEFNLETMRFNNYTNQESTTWTT